MKKAIFFDIDGTIITEDERAFIPESTKQAIKKARKNGHLTFINTGRTIFTVSDEIKSLGFDGYLCGCGTYIEYNDEVLLHNRLADSFCHEIVNIVRQCNAIPVYERHDCLFFDEKTIDSNEITYFKKFFLKNGISTDNTTADSNFSFDKFVIFGNENTDIELFKKSVGKHFTIIDRGDGLYENVPIGYTKATSIDIILNKLGISIENAYAIGDSANDLPMLTAVPNSIAMGGAEKIYPYVSYITKPIDEDGIEHALKHFEII